MSDQVTKAELIALLAKFYRNYEGERVRQIEAGHELYAARAKGGQSAIAAIAFNFGIADEVQKCTGLGTMQ